VNAAVLGKVMLIAEDLRVGERFRERPLIYPIVIESLMLSILFILVHILEHVIGGMIAGETLRASIPAIGGGGVQGLLCVGLILFVALLPFFAFRRITKEVGTARIKAMLFGEPAT
jgi:hypothetical protein